MPVRPLSAGTLLLVLLCLPAWRASAEEDEERKLKAGDRDPAFIARVNESIKRGVSYVQSQQQENGSWTYVHDRTSWNTGCTALSLLALLKSGVNRFDPCIEKGFRFLKTRPFKKNYSTALTILALEARWRENKPEENIKGHTRAVFKRPKIPRADLDWMREAVKFLLDNREYCVRSNSGAGMGGKDAWSYPKGGKDNYADHSNTQFGLLGLKAASRCGVRVPKEAFKKALVHFLEYQETAGPKVQRWKMVEDRKHGYVIYKAVTRRYDEARGWAYGGSVKPVARGDALRGTSGSMTCVGIASVIICLSELGPRDLGKGMQAKALKAVNDGLAWMDKHFTVTKNPGHPEGAWLYYYLYGIERAAVLAKVRNLGRHDWYREGAEYLMANQDGSGEWRHADLWGSGVTPSTCLALLFLTKATVPVQTKTTGH